MVFAWNLCLAGFTTEGTEDTEKILRFANRPLLPPCSLCPRGEFCLECTMRYAELHCKTNFSFLEGASHADELVRQAAALGYRAWR